MPYALDELARDLRDLREHSTQHRQATGGPHWLEGSLADQEFASLDEFARGHYRDLYGFVELRLAAAEELLSAAGMVLADESLIWSLYPLVRGAAEFSARAAWLLDPEATAAERARRVLGDRIHSLGEQGKVPIPGAREAAQARKREVMAEAARAGLTPRPPLNMTDLMDRIYGRDDGKLGEVTYRHLSAFAHGAAYAMTRLVRPMTDEAGERIPAVLEGTYLAEMATDTQADAVAVLAAIIPYTEATSRYIAWSGRDSDDWRIHIAKCGHGARQFLPDGDE